MYCSNCGMDNADGAVFCKNCGASLMETQEVSIPDDDIENKPISMWGYLGYEILFALPVIGLICLLIFSFGGNKNRNVQNFARSYFCMLIVYTILVIVFFVTALQPLLEYWM